MKLPWRSGKEKEGGAGLKSGAQCDSEFEVASRVLPGVTFRIGRVSFDRRLELMRHVRELARRADFLKAGETPGDKMDAALLQAEIERIYVSWGVKAVEGLTLNGVAAGPAELSAGPEDLFREALAAVRKELGLTEEERKNS